MTVGGAVISPFVGPQLAKQAKQLFPVAYAGPTRAPDSSRRTPSLWRQTSPDAYAFAFCSLEASLICASPAPPRS